MAPYFRMPNMLLLLTLIALAPTGCQKESASEPTAQSADTKQITVDITGMT